MSSLGLFLPNVEECYQIDTLTELSVGFEWHKSVLRKRKLIEKKKTFKAFLIELLLKLFMILRDFHEFSLRA